MHTLSFLRYHIPEESEHLETQEAGTSFYNARDGTHSDSALPDIRSIRSVQKEPMEEIMPPVEDTKKISRSVENNSPVHKDEVGKSSNEVPITENKNEQKKVVDYPIVIPKVEEGQVIFPPISQQKKILLNFAHGCCKNAQRKNARTGQEYGFDIVHEYSMDDLDDEFRKKYDKILSQGTGGGFWLWKPYLVLRAMNEANWGDIIIYTDAGSHWKNSPDDRLVAYANNPDLHVCNRPYSCGACTIDHEIKASSPELLQKCGQDVVDLIRGQDVHVWDVGLKETTWTKRDIFVALDLDREPYTTTSQMSAHVLMVRKSPSSVQFVKDWLGWGTDPAEYITNKGSKAKNFPNFRSNRHDQSLLSMLYKKYGYSPNPYPSSDWLVHDRDHS